MASVNVEKVLKVYHWNENLFSFITTRNKSFRFENGHFVMLGIKIEDKPIMRAYSIVSANYEENLEFFSIKVPNGKLTSHLKELKIGDEVLISNKSVGTLVIDSLNKGKNLYLLATGTGLAPFMSIIKDFSIYERFEKIILVHSVRKKSDLAYRDYIESNLDNNELLGGLVEKQLIYYPTVTQEQFYNNSRITNLLLSDNFFLDIKLPKINPTNDRVMICGNSEALVDISIILNNIGFKGSLGINKPGDYVLEKAFVN
ncbi:ferredoxin--NADP reductase [Candidatus Kinetoplastidibacterium crithidiae]|uniref:ferredoxin--NADP(+) reductase n=1 Tax=Candidatus Kinetoplastidibacterium crithidiae TCC036E TaxID=1208918 RepID=M1LPQ4_9PROT|nr:ferredoxin--NADP reductase [Candidatus Kinetoplastibacterium crithidii]AFZ82706.1 ferredoxin--NADP reductase [Candidatus Kinetoplastibacterium crithidii (ex Angomonas deanei ATCC 30255)]AGF47642.1 ferredoxin--NADP+ reductase [Candidatus Kinetoplastibacterium crithidii TCC036E]